MSNNDNKETGIALLLFGVVLLVVGIIFSLYEQRETLNLYGMSVPYSAGYPYRDIGLVLLLGGILLIIGGVIVTEMKPKKDFEKNFSEIKDKTPVNQDDELSEWFCTNCGFKNKKEAKFCKKCGNPNS